MASRNRVSETLTLRMEREQNKLQPTAAAFYRIGLQLSRY